MSIKTWKKEFYPTTAKSVAKNMSNSDIVLIDHCIVKWKGAKEKNIKAHNVVRIVNDWGNRLTGKSGAVFHFDAESCALCQRYDTAGCSGCPLYESRGGRTCFWPTNEESKVGKVSPYEDPDPRAMIKALKKARMWVLKQEKV